MTTTRREFLSHAFGASLALAGAARAQDTRPAARQLDILVFGGTGFLGPAFVRAALARGHRLTLFNRGRTRTHLFPEVARIVGDRDPAKGEGLKNLAKVVGEGRRFDAVLDDIAYYPVLLRPSLELLKDAAAHYVLISSISAYARNDAAGQDESAPVAQLDDPARRDMGKEYEHYGALKAACEAMAESLFPKRCTNVRPGYIVGPEDPTDRFTWYPARHARGGEMLWPGTPDDPLQIIDVRDLGAWLVTVIERRHLGVFNAVGPGEAPWTMGGLLAACKEASGAGTKPVWVPAEFLAQQGEKGDAGIPIWMPPMGESLGYHRYANAKARAAGLTFRDPKATTRDTLEWFRSLPAQRTETQRANQLRAGLAPERERAILAAWRDAKR